MAAPMCRGMRRLPSNFFINSLFFQRSPLTQIGSRCIRTFPLLNKSHFSRKFKITTATVTLASVFVVSCLQKSESEVDDLENTQSAAPKLAIPKTKISRTVPGVTDLKGYKITLFQFQSCPFCCKARAALDFYGFSYNVVEVNSITKRELKWSQYKKVPVMLVESTNGDDHVQVVDSTQITSVLGSYMINPDQPVDQLVTAYPAILNPEKKRKTYDYPNRYFLMFGENKNDNCSDTERRKEMKWRKWVDDTFIHVISPAVYHTFSEARETFKHFSKVGEWDRHFSDMQRISMIEIGSLVMYFISRMLKKKHHIKENPMDSMVDACQEWIKGLNKDNYMGGNQPSLADLAMYGGLHSFKGCKAFQEVMELSKLRAWYGRMETDIANHRGVEIAGGRSSPKA